MECKVSDEIKKDIKQIIIKLDKLVTISCHNNHLIKLIIDKIDCLHISKNKIKNSVFYKGQKFRIFFKSDNVKKDRSKNDLLRSIKTNSED